MTLVKFDSHVQHAELQIVMGLLAGVGHVTAVLTECRCAELVMAMLTAMMSTLKNFGMEFYLGISQNVRQDLPFKEKMSITRCSNVA